MRVLALDRSFEIAWRCAGAVLVLATLCGLASAESLPAIIEARLAPIVPAGFGIAHVYAPTTELAPAQVTVEVPGELKAGRPSVKVTIKGKTTYVPIAIARLAEVAVATHAIAEGATLVATDFTVEERPVEPGVPAASLVGASVAHAIAAHAPISRTDVLLAPPLARGTQVALEIRRGSVRVRGTATLEAAARAGGPAIVRVAQTKTVLRGVLVAPATVVIGDQP